MARLLILLFVYVFGFTFKHRLRPVKLRIYPGLPNRTIREVGFKIVRGDNFVFAYSYYNPKDPIAKGAVLYHSSAITSSTISKDIGSLRSAFFISDYLKNKKPLCFIDNFYDEGLVLFELEYATPTQAQEHLDEINSHMSIC